MYRPKIGAYVGIIGEEFAESYLKKKGYEVCPYPLFGSIFAIGVCQHLKCVKECEKEKCPKYQKHEHDENCVYYYHKSFKYSCRLPEFNNIPCQEVYPSICRSCSQNPCLVVKLIDIEKLFDKDVSRPSGKVHPDFIAHKNGEHYLVEVKTNTGKLSKLQKEFLKRAREIGIKTIRILVKLEVTHEIGEEVIE